MRIHILDDFENAVRGLASFYQPVQISNPKVLRHRTP
jgi:hypothetical protein